MRAARAEELGSRLGARRIALHEIILVLVVVLVLDRVAGGKSSPRLRLQPLAR